VRSASSAFRRSSATSGSVPTAAVFKRTNASAPSYVSCLALVMLRLCNGANVTPLLKALGGPVEAGRLRRAARRGARPGGDLELPAGAQPVQRVQPHADSGGGDRSKLSTSISAAVDRAESVATVVTILARPPFAILRTAFVISSTADRGLLDTAPVSADRRAPSSDSRGIRPDDEARTESTGVRHGGQAAALSPENTVGAVKSRRTAPHRS
jgi:hypothetical protein